MDVAHLLKRDFEIGEILEMRNMSKSNRCYFILTSEHGYVFKNVERLDFINIYDKVQNVLNGNGFMQPKIVRTKNHALMSDEGYSLFDFVPGDALEQYDDSQFWSIVRHLNGYNAALRRVPFASQEIDEVNVWDKLKSPEFMCNTIDLVTTTKNVDAHTKELLRNSKTTLTKYKPYFSFGKRQLIHADLGPGNVVFNDNNIRAIIDFTPAYEHELYSLSQFLYWTCLWTYEESTSLHRIKSAIRVYYDGHQKEECPEGVFPYLLKACLFRTLGPILNLMEEGEFHVRKVQRRMSILATLFDIQSELS